MTDVPINIKITSDEAVKGKQVVVRSLGEIRSEAEKTNVSLKKIKSNNSELLGSFDRLAQRTKLAESRLKDLALAGQSNTDRFIRLKNAIDNNNLSLQKAQSQTEILILKNKSLDNSFKQMNSLDLLKNSLGGLGIVIGTLEIAQFIKDIVVLGAKFDLTTKRIESFLGVGAQSREAISFIQSEGQRTGISILSIGDGFSKIIPFVKSGIVTLKEAKDITQGMNSVALALGTTSDQVGNTMYGLSQALSSGIVRAEEFNQVVEPMPGLLQAMDEAAGLPAGGLRKLINDGHITSEMFKKILIPAMKSFEDEAKKMSDSVQSNVGRLGNSLVGLGSTMWDWIDGPANMFIKSLDAIAKGLTSISNLSETDLLETISGKSTSISSVRKEEARQELLKRNLISNSGMTLKIPGTENEKRASITQDGAIIPIPGTEAVKDKLKPAEGLEDLSETLNGILNGKTGKTGGKGGKTGRTSRLSNSLRKSPEQQLSEDMFSGDLQIDQIIANDELDRLEEANDLINSVKTAQEKYNDELARLNQLKPELIKLLSDEDKAEKVILDNLKDEEEAINAVKNAQDKQWESFYNNISRAITSADNFDDMLNNIYKTLLNNLIPQLLKASSGMDSAFSGLSSDSSFGNITDAIGSALSGTSSTGGNTALPEFRANGGPIVAGKPYIMGEDGPELVVAPSNGFVIPNKMTKQILNGVNDAKSMPNMFNITMTVNATDANSFNRSRNQIMGDLMRQMQVASGRVN